MRAPLLVAVYFSIPVAPAAAAERPPVTCRPLALGDGCVASAPHRPFERWHADRNLILVRTPNGIFSFGRKEAFDASTVRWATVRSCPLWGNVYVWDARDVYVQFPQSCGGSNCGGDYTGYSWGGLKVQHPERFRWLPAAYGVDGEHVYSKYRRGPLVGARPEDFEVMLCGGSDGYVLGRSRSGKGELWYLDGNQTPAPR